MVDPLTAQFEIKGLTPCAEILVFSCVFFNGNIILSVKYWFNIICLSTDIEGAGNIITIIHRYVNKAVKRLRFVKGNNQPFYALLLGLVVEEPGLDPY